MAVQYHCGETLSLFDGFPVNFEVSVTLLLSTVMLIAPPYGKWIWETEKERLPNCFSQGIGSCFSEDKENVVFLPRITNNKL